MSTHHLKQKNKSENYVSTNFIEDFEKLAKKLDVIKIGYYQIDSEFFNNNLKHRNIIILILKMNEDIIELGPSKKAKELNKNLYSEIRQKLDILSEFLNKKSLETEIAYPNEKLIDLSYLAQEAGLGQIGKNGLLIIPEVGSKIKIGAILTSNENLPFSTTNKHKWILDYCKNCEECIKSCDSNSLIISENNNNNNNSNGNNSNNIKASLDVEACIGSKEGCSYCIKKCPFNIKSYLTIKKEFDAIE
ncbi:MAG: hypothetical protein ACRCVG_05340 [Methanobacteriaceae archaeon]